MDGVARSMLVRTVQAVSGSCKAKQRWAALRGSRNCGEASTLAGWRGASNDGMGLGQRLEQFVGAYALSSQPLAQPGLGIAQQHPVGMLFF